VGGSPASSPKFGYQLAAISYQPEFAISLSEILNLKSLIAVPCAAEGCGLMPDS
jgi:hypothetical protein